MMTLHSCRKDLIFNKFTYEGKKTSQDCINGLMFLFSKCKELHLINLNCQSAVLYKTAEPAETQVSTVHFDNCVLEHPDIEPEMRIVPSCKHVSLCLKYTSKLFQIG